MSGTDTSQWKKIGSTSNADVYEIEDDILVIAPHANCVDNEKTARESITIQAEHWKKVGHRGGTVVLMDNVLEQDAGARGVYMNETVDHPSTCFALVGETFYGRAVSAVFTGLSKPAVPTNIFRSLEDARPWIADMNKERGGKL
jgi:hypothetical protein